MVARKTAKERAKLRRHNEQLIRRSPKLSNGAKLLWLELSAWAWDDPTCFPKQELLVLALGKERSTISRYATELKKHKLITIRKLRRGNEYVLCEEIPMKVCDPARGFNKNLVRMLREESDVAEMPSQGAERRDESSQKRNPDVAEMPHHPPCDVAEMPHPDVAEMPHPIDEVHQREVHQEKRSRSSEVLSSVRSARTTTKGDGESLEVSARSARIRERTEDDEEQGTYVPDTPQPEDLSELMEDPPPPKNQRQRNQRQKRGPDSAIVGLPGDGLRNAGKPREGTKTVGAEPPPPKKPADVLSLLRGEIEEKYGKKAVRGVPLELSGKEAGQVQKSIMNKFPPDVVIDMVRVLVWDWEIARVSCFPYKPQAPIPTIEALAQYQEILSSAISTGLKYDGGVRGAWDTYANRYLNDQPGSESEVPF